MAGGLNFFVTTMRNIAREFKVFLVSIRILWIDFLIAILDYLIREHVHAKTYGQARRVNLLEKITPIATSFTKTRVERLRKFSSKLHAETKNEENPH